jgi:hypothetical protein
LNRALRTDPLPRNIERDPPVDPNHIAAGCRSLRETRRYRCRNGSRARGRRGQLECPAAVGLHMLAVVFRGRHPTQLSNTAARARLRPPARQVATDQPALAGPSARPRLRGHDTSAS